MALGMRIPTYHVTAALVRDSMIPNMDQIVQDKDRDPFQQFDDYMEIVVQLGYVTQGDRV
jgi:hypothetical protein